MICRKNIYYFLVLVTVICVFLPQMAVYAQTPEPTATPTSTPIPTCLPNSFEVMGHVRDILTTDPISGAEVYASTASTSSHNDAYTDVNGFYQFTVATCTSAELIDFQITADGYEERIISVYSSSDYFGFNLIPLSGPTPSPGPAGTCLPISFFATGYITDIATGDPVPGATVMIDTDIGTTGAQGFSLGKYYLPVMGCNLGDLATFTISSPEYETMVIVLEIEEIIEYNFELTANECTLGDVNEDDFIDIVDALLIAQYYVGLIELPNICAAELNCDGQIDIIDALLVAQYYVGLILSFC